MSKPLIIIGGGSSIKEFPNLWDDIASHDVMSINYAYRFLKQPPKYQVSIDKLFLFNNADDMSKLSEAGTMIIGQQGSCVVDKTFNPDGNLFCGKKKLSGIFALDYALRILKRTMIFLFGYDYGFIDGKSHFYDNIEHSGIKKSRAYYDAEGNIDGVGDFDNFVGASVFIVGQSNIKCFPKIKYYQFTGMVNR